VQFNGRRKKLMPMQQFEIILKNDKIKSYKFIALLLVSLNIVVFIYLIIARIHFYEASGALLLSGLYIIYRMYVAKKSRTAFFINEITFFILSGCWMALQSYFMAIACATLGILYNLSLQKILFLFNDNFVKKINFPQREYQWGMFTNIVLKDNILTVDFRNNKLIQVEIENKINETQFNEFARQQLFKAPVYTEKQT
jgi:hypothetical protein